MKKILTSLAAAATLALASTSAMADFVPFTVNETVIPSTGTDGSVFAANNMTGKYGELLGLTSATTFSASAVGHIASYAVGNTLTPSLLNIAENKFGGVGYGMYAVFVASGTAISSTQFVGTGGHMEIWLDTKQDTTFDFNGDFTSLATKGLDGDDVMIGSSSISYGSGDLIGPPGAFNIYFKQFQLTAFGATYWTGIDTMQFVLQTNGDIDGITPDPTQGGVPPFSVLGDFSANFTVPEPASLVLVGASLLGLGFASRRRQAK